MGEATKGIMATRKQNLNKFYTSEDLVQKNIYMPGEIPNDRWYNRVFYSFSNCPSQPSLPTSQQPRRTFQASGRNNPSAMLFQVTAVGFDFLNLISIL